MKRTLYVLVVLIIIVAVYFLMTKNTTAPVVVDRSGEESTAESSRNTSNTNNLQKEIIYMCDQGKATLILSGNDFVNAQVIVEDHSHELMRVVSASGARYATADESVVFWSKGTSAFITENGETTYENCNEK